MAIPYEVTQETRSGFDSLTRLVQNPLAACCGFIMVIYNI